MASILVLDDSASVRDAIRLALSGQGHVVKEAANGLQGLGLAEHAKFDLILTDLNMPEMDGLAFIQHIRQRADHNGVPIVFITTESSPSVMQQAKKAGATGWIVKPFSADQLRRVVDKVLA
jgi:two-component system chemotaxis response regulator CheY